MRWTLRKHGTRRAILLSLSGLFLFLLAYQIWGEHGYLALRRKWDQERAWLRRIEEQRRRNTELEKQIDDLRNNPEAIKQRAREDLLMVEPAEQVIVKPPKNGRQ